MVFFQDPRHFFGLIIQNPCTPKIPIPTLEKFRTRRPSGPNGVSPVTAWPEQ